MASRGRGSKQKGQQAEREVAAILSEQLGADIKRIYLSGMKGEGDLEGLPAVHCEVKRREQQALWAWIQHEWPKAKEKNLPLAIFHRRNREGWQVTMPIEDWIRLMRAAL